MRARNTMVYGSSMDNARENSHMVCDTMSVDIKADFQSGHAAITIESEVNSQRQR